MRTAYEIGIPPHLFWRMTLRSFVLCFEGAMRARMHDLRARAWEVAHQVNLWAKDPVTPAQLLGEDKPAPIVTSPEDWRAHMAEKRKRQVAKLKAKYANRKQGVPRV